MKYWRKTRVTMSLFTALALTLGVAGHAHAVSIAVPIDSFTNEDLRTYTNGANYPVAPTTLMLGGVPFNLVPFGVVPNSLGIIQTPPGASVFTIPTNIDSPTTIYTLINSAFGSTGATNGTVEFVGAGGAMASFDLVQGVNIRDHYDGFFNNTVTDPTIVTENFGGEVRFDRQTFVLPSTFASDTLTQIRFIGTNAGIPEGQAFLAAVTVVTADVNVAGVPEPGTIYLLGTGLIGLLAASGRKRERHLS